MELAQQQEPLNYILAIKNQLNPAYFQIALTREKHVAQAREYTIRIKMAESYLRTETTQPSLRAKERKHGRGFLFMCIVRKGEKRIAQGIHRHKLQKTNYKKKERNVQQKYAEEERERNKRKEKRLKVEEEKMKDERSGNDITQFPAVSLMLIMNLFHIISKGSKQAALPSLSLSVRAETERYKSSTHHTHNNIQEQEVKEEVNRKKNEEKRRESKTYRTGLRESIFRSRRGRGERRQNRNQERPTSETRREK